MAVSVFVGVWSIREYTPGDLYADIYCPHGEPVEVINTGKKTIDPLVRLERWLEETKEWRENYCYH